MNEELKKAVINKVEELLDKPLMDAKIQIDYHRDEIPAIRYDITECLSVCLSPKARSSESEDNAFTCEDAISRQAVLEIVEREEYKGDALFEIEKLPPVTPKPKTGRWIDGKCNRCGTHAPYWAMASGYYLSEYCPHCGAKMGAESEETNADSN